MSWTPTFERSAGNRSRRRVSATALLLVLWSASGNAHAEDVLNDDTDAPAASSEGSRTDEARRQYEAGRARFDVGDYPAALSYFRRAHQLVPADVLVYNIAQAERLSGQCAAAARSYREFLALGPMGRLRELAEDHLKELGACEGEAELARSAAPAPAQSESSQRDKGAPQRVRPSRRPVLGVPAKSCSAGLPCAEVTGLRPERPAARRERPERSRAPVLALGVSFGSAVVLLGASGYFAWRSDRASDRVSRAFERGEPWHDGLAADERQGPRDQAFAIASLAGGALAAGIGTWLLARD